MQTDNLKVGGDGKAGEGSGEGRRGWGKREGEKRKGEKEKEKEKRERKKETTTGCCKLYNTRATIRSRL